MAEYKDIFKIKHNDLTPERGKILISEPFLQDAYFQRSVILLVEHNETGSLGFVLNKRTGLWLNDFFDGMENLQRIPIYLGGPVASDRLFFIHSLGKLIPDSIQISDDLYFDGDFEALKYYILNDKYHIDRMKFFLGYSGWTENQLENEIKHNSWLVGNIGGENIMNVNGESYWKYSVECIGGQYSAWVNFPKDPILN